MNLSIVTPVFNNSHLTSEFIQSIVPYLHFCELIIVDNNSTDNTLTTLSVAKKNFKNVDIKIFSNSKNVGFGAANNIGARLAKSDKILFISNDVKILGDVIHPVFEFLENDRRAAVGARLLNHNTGWNTFKEVGTIPYLEGFCFAVHKEHFNIIGGFDENFFLDMEDLDLCHRLRLSGVALAQINLPVMHQLGGSFGSLDKSRLDITLQSQDYFLRKWGFHKE